MGMTRLKSELVNFLSHAIGLVAMVPLTILLGFKAWGHPTVLASVMVYGAAVMFLFFASANYHRLKQAENERNIQRTMDHVAIFIMIAGCYTPIIVIWFEAFLKPWALGLIWGIALTGFFLKIFVKKSMRWLSTLLYLAMGWAAIFVIVPLYSLMSPDSFWAMAGGGVLYSIGAVIYGLKKPNPLPGTLGFHEIFHLFILAAAGLHYWMVYSSLESYLAKSL